MHSSRTDVSLLLLRFILGIVFIAHGAQKMFGAFDGPGLHTFASHMPAHLPPVFGYLVAFGEFFGGLGVLVGLLTRIAVLGPVLSMLGAVLLVHGKNGFFGGPHNGFEYPLTLLFIGLAILISGPGIYSLDASLHRGRRVTLPRLLTT